MATLTITPADVGINSANSPSQPYQAGEAIQQGEPFYLGADSKAYVATNDDTEAKAKVVGLAVTAASTDGYFLSVSDSKYLPGATMTQGTLYYLGSAGAIVEASDITSGDFITSLFRADSATSSVIELKATGITK